MQSIMADVQLEEIDTNETVEEAEEIESSSDGENSVSSTSTIEFLQSRALAASNLLSAALQAQNLPIVEPKQIEKMHRRLSNKEVFQLLSSWQDHPVKLSTEPAFRPASGELYLFDKRKVPNFRKDGHDWKTRPRGKSLREDHVKLKVDKRVCIYACYAHSSVIQNFHRRLFWLMNEPNIILIHYLNDSLSEARSRPNQFVVPIPMPLTSRTSSLSKYTPSLSPSLALPKLGQGSFEMQQAKPSLSLPTSSPMLLASSPSASSPPSTTSSSTSTSTSSSTASSLVSSSTLGYSLDIKNEFAELLSQTAGGPPLEFDFNALISSSQPPLLPSMHEMQPSHERVYSEDFDTEQFDLQASFDENDSNFNDEMDSSIILLPEEDCQNDQMVYLSSPSSFCTSLFSQQAPPPSATTVNHQSAFFPQVQPDYDIYDYSPEWSYTEGNVKVLLMGNWNEESSDRRQYTVRFGDMTVSAEEVMPGVLRCYAPAHAEGHVELQIHASDNTLSRPVFFEYRNLVNKDEWQKLSEYVLFTDLMRALSDLEDSITMIAHDLHAPTPAPASNAEMTAAVDQVMLEMHNKRPSDSLAVTQEHFERGVVSTIVRAASLIGADALAGFFWQQEHEKGFTLAHYTCALGYASLLTLVLSTTRNQGLVSAAEAALNDLTPDIPCTPFTMACIYGQSSVVRVYVQSHLVPMNTPSERAHLRQVLKEADRRNHITVASLLRECLQTDPESPRTAWVRDAIMNVLHLKAEAEQSGQEATVGEDVLNQEALKIQRAFRRYKQHMRQVHNMNAAVKAVTSESSSMLNGSTFGLGLHTNKTNNANVAPDGFDNLLGSGGNGNMPSNSLAAASARIASSLHLPSLAIQRDAQRNAQTIQRAFRQYKVRKEQRAAVLIQSRFRGHRQRQLYKETVTTILKIQQRWRKQHKHQPLNN